VRFLIDTNVFISSEPTRHAEFEAFTSQGLELARLAAGEHMLVVHPSVLDEIANDNDLDRREVRQRVVARYRMLEAPPPVQPEVAAVLGEPTPRSHDWYDHELLAAVFGNAVHGLVTQDDRIHRKATRLGIGDRVYYLADAIAALEALQRQPPDFLPSVEFKPMHQLDLTDSFFDSLRADYDGFDDWFRDKQADGREAFVVTGPDGCCAGICAPKAGDDEIGVGGRVTKVTTLKVADEFKGNRYGELLLKALFRHLHRNHDDWVWLTVFEKHRDLIDLLAAFGFEDVGAHATGERRYAKRLTPPSGGDLLTDPLAFHCKYGPPALMIEPDQTVIIPIRPEYHEGLFPDAPTEPGAPMQLPGLAVPRPHGNALRKAYLCRAAIRSLAEGATLLFYRSDDRQAVTTIGVLEAHLISSDPGELLDFVGTRTVYSAEEVAAMASRGEVLALRFRQDRFLEPPITIDEMQGAQAVKRAPQSIHRVHKEAIPWLKSRIGA